MSAFPHVRLDPFPCPGYESTFEANMDKLKDLEKRVEKIRARALCIDNMRSATYRDVCMLRRSHLLDGTPIISPRMGGDTRIPQLGGVVLMALDNADRITTAIMRHTQTLVRTISRTINRLGSVRDSAILWYTLPAKTVAAVQALLDKTNEPLKMMRQALANAEVVGEVGDRIKELEEWLFRCNEEENELLLQRG